MSRWWDITYDKEKGDIDLNGEGDEIQILFDSDDEGNKYIAIKTKDMIEFLKDKGKI